MTVGNIDFILSMGECPSMISNLLTHSQMLNFLLPERCSINLEVNLEIVAFSSQLLIKESKQENKTKQNKKTTSGIFTPI